MVNKANKIGSNYGLAQLLQPVSIKKKKKKTFLFAKPVRSDLELIYYSNQFIVLNQL